MLLLVGACAPAQSPGMFAGVPTPTQSSFVSPSAYHRHSSSSIEGICDVSEQRGQSPYLARKFLESEDKCAATCHQSPRCTGYEFATIISDRRNYRLCHFQSGEIVGVIPVPGYKCMMKRDAVPSKIPTFHRPTSSSTQWPPAGAGAGAIAHNTAAAPSAWAANPYGAGAAGAAPSAAAPSAAAPSAAAPSAAAPSAGVFVPTPKCSGVAAYDKNCKCCLELDKLIVDAAATGAVVDLAMQPTPCLEFTNADFRNRDLSNVFMEEALMNCAIFDGVKMAGAVLNMGKLDGASFRRADLTGAEMEEVQASGAVFTGATLSGTVFELANVADAKFNNAVLDAAVFMEATVSGADFTGATPADLATADFTGAIGCAGAKGMPSPPPTGCA